MSDDDDYMSDKFLQGSEKSSAPSLLYRHADKRQLSLIKKKLEIETKMKEKHSIKYMEQEKREEGLSSAIASTNKGFELLMKMGYKPGQGIGKAESGIIEPIGVEVKADRHGLGKGTKRKQENKSNTENKLDNKVMKDFRGRIAQKRTEQLYQADLHKSQKICEQLDLQLNIEEPLESWYWLPKETKANTDSEDEEEDEEEEEEEEETSQSISEKLEILTKYLRTKHFYCIWCGVAFNDENDLSDNCPGDTRQDH